VDLNVDLSGAFNRIGDDASGLIERNEDLFTNDEVRAQINARNAVGAVDYAAENIRAADRCRGACRPKVYSVIAENLKRINPDIEPLGGVSIDHRTAAMRGDKALRPNCLGIKREPRFKGSGWNAALCV